MSDPVYYDAAPLSTLFHGDVTIETGSNPELHGPGDLKVYRQAHIGIGPNNSTESVNSSTGSLVVWGGAGITGNSNLKGILTVNSTSNLQTTFIDTTLGPLSVSGGNAVNIVVDENVTLTSNISTVSVSANNNIILEANQAIKITNTNSAGGIEIKSGQNNGLNISTGSLGIVGRSEQGPISLNTYNGSGEFIVNTTAAYSRNLTLKVVGSDIDSGILIQSDGINTVVPSIHMNTTHSNGKIYITNNITGNNNFGAINLYAGSDGLIATTNTGGAMEFTARDASSYFIVDSTGEDGLDGSHLTLAVRGNTNSSLILESDGTNQAIRMKTTHQTGSIKVEQVNGSGSVNISTGSSGFGVATQAAGPINLLANSATSSFINQTTSDGENLTIAVEGNTQSKVILRSSGTVPDAITIEASGTNGGISATALGFVSVQSAKEINIGTNAPSNTPVNIGSATSLTTINGNLDVRGVTTTYESTIVQIADNILELNTVPLPDSNAGIAIKRYQSANNNALGNVIADTAEVTGLVVDADTLTITLDSNADATDNIYSGYWIKITTGTGQNAVRRIKSNVGRVATIYSTADQIGDLLNVSPREGLNWGATDDLSNTSSIPTTGSGYSLHPCEWIVNMWDEARNEWAIVCSNHISGGVNATPVNPLHYVDLHINDLKANALTVNTINNLTADVQFSVTLTNNSTVGVQLNPSGSNVHPPQVSYPKYGLFIALVRPTTETSTRCYAVFILGRRDDSSSTGQVARIISVKGTSGEMLDMEWAADSYPALRYRPAPGSSSSATTNYTIKIITV